MRKYDKRQRLKRRIDRASKSNLVYGTPKVKPGTRVIAKAAYTGSSSPRFHDPIGNMFKSSIISSPSRRGVKKRFSRD